MYKKLLLIGIVSAFAGCQAEPQNSGDSAANEVEFLNPSSFYSEAVRVGNTLYLSGKIGTIPGEGRLAPGGIKGETKQVLENIKAVLERHGSSLDRVVKVTVFLADIAEWGDMNEVYTTYFPNNPPARSALGTSGLARGARVEIECIATITPDNK